MGRLFLLARRKAWAFAVVELLVVLLLCVLGGLMLPNFAPTVPSPPKTIPAADNPSGAAPAVTADGSVRPIKFNISESTFPQPADVHDSHPISSDY